MTPNRDIDLAIALTRQKDTILATFGDMMRVPGWTSNLQREKAEGRDIRIVYSPLDALAIARDCPIKRVIFFAIGFETTSPTIAAAILQAAEERLRNLFILDSQKRIPPALQVLLQAKRVKIDGFILPGHVSAILGTTPYKFLSREFGRPAVITGFEPLDILQGIWMLVKQIEDGRISTSNTGEWSMKKGTKLPWRRLRKSLKRMKQSGEASGRFPKVVTVSRNRF